MLGTSPLHKITVNAITQFDCHLIGDHPRHTGAYLPGWHGVARATQEIPRATPSATPKLIRHGHSLHSRSLGLLIS